MRTPPERPADGVVGWIYESFVPGEWHRWLEKEIPWFCFLWAEPERMISGWTAFSRDSSKTEKDKAYRGSGYHSLLLRRKMSIVSPSPGRLSPGRKTPPRVSVPSPGLRLLIVSRFKWGRGPYRGHSVIPCAGNTIWLQYSFIKELLEDSTSACRERVVAATGPSPFKVRDNQRPERTMSGVENLRLSVPSPAIT